MQQPLVPFILSILSIDVHNGKNIDPRAAWPPSPHRISLRLTARLLRLRLKGGSDWPWERGRPARILSLPMLPPPPAPPGQGANREHPLHHKPGTWLTPCHSVGQGALCRPQDHSPLEGESARGRSPRSSRWGGAFPRLVSYRDYLHRWTGHTGLPFPVRRLVIRGII